MRIWSWQHVSVNISSVAELSPVYCCLVCFTQRSVRIAHIHFIWALQHSSALKEIEENIRNTNIWILLHILLMVKLAWIIHEKKWSVIFSLILPLNSSTVKIKQRENRSLNISQIMAHNYKMLIIAKVCFAHCSTSRLALGSPGCLSSFVVRHHAQNTTLWCFRPCKPYIFWKL